MSINIIIVAYINDHTGNCGEIELFTFSCTFINKTKIKNKIKLNRKKYEIKILINIIIIYKE